MGLLEVTLDHPEAGEDFGETLAGEATSVGEVTLVEEGADLEGEEIMVEEVVSGEDLALEAITVGEVTLEEAGEGMLDGVMVRLLDRVV